MSEPGRLSKAGQKVKAVPRPNPVERRVSKFLREPPKLRTAASVIVTATLVVVVGGGVLFRLLDHKEYPNIGTGMWFALQTVTTVGYGDVTPKDAAGKLVAALIMLEGIAFLAIVTAAITSTFVARAAAERLTAVDEADTNEESHIDARLDEFAEQLNRLESMMNRISGPTRTSPAPRTPPLQLEAAPTSRQARTGDPQSAQSGGRRSAANRPLGCTHLEAPRLSPVPAKRNTEPVTLSSSVSTDRSSWALRPSTFDLWRRDQLTRAPCSVRAAIYVTDLARQGPRLAKWPNEHELSLAFAAASAPRPWRPPAPVDIPKRREGRDDARW